MKFHKRGFTSLLLFFGFLVLIVSGAVLYGSPKGRVAHWTGWTMFGLQKETWESMHVNTAILILIVSGFHLYFNWRRFWRYITTSARRAINLKAELALAVLLAAGIVAGAALAIPPFSSVMDLNAHIQTCWQRSSPRAPAPHAEEFRLSRLAGTIGLPAEKVVEALRKEGFEVRDETVTVRQVAESKGVAPCDVFAAITKHYKELIKSGHKPGERRRRRGK